MTSFMDSSSLRDDAMVNPNVYNMMRQDMSNNMIQRNRMNQMSSQHMFDMMDKSSNMRDNNMMGQNMLNRNKMGQKMSTNMMGRDMSSNMMNTYVNDVNRLPLGQRNTMSQRMQIEQIPQ